MLDKTTCISPTDGVQARNNARQYPESHDQYCRVVACLCPKTRVIECPAGIQWIVQRKNGQRWIGMSFCCTREALLRCARQWVPGAHPALLALPERLS
jgi:hypothetical protein